MGGKNFVDVLPTGKYSYSQRVILYVKKENKTIRFSHNPELKEYAGSFTDQEWKYLKKKGHYLFLRKEGEFWYAEK